MPVRRRRAATRSAARAPRRGRAAAGDELGEQASAGAEQVALAAVRLGSRRRDQQLVGDPARDRAAGRDAVALEHRRAPPADRARRHGRRPGAGSHASCEWECGRRRAGLVALVEEREADAARRPGPAAARPPRRGRSSRRSRSPNECTWRGRGSRPPAARAPDRGSARRERPSRSARRRAAASRAACGPRGPRRTGSRRGRRQALARCARPLGARPARSPTQRPVIGSWRRSASARLLALVADGSRNGLSMSTGTGKTIVVDCDEPSSSSVCR